jgi:uncharacterized protein (DUF4415 family)
MMNLPNRRGPGRPPLPPGRKKVKMTIRIDPAVLARLQGLGRGWTTLTQKAIEIGLQELEHERR